MFNAFELILSEIQLNNQIIAEKGNAIEPEVLTETSNLLQVAHMIIYFINDKFVGLQTDQN